jgi:serine/threonine-protein kinase
MQRIGPYEILERVGAGGMGSVYVARDPRLDRRVAVKVLLNPDPDPDEVARFEREARAIAALNHPNILAIHDIGRDGDRPYIVMELLDGRTLREVLDAGALPVRKALTYGLEIAQGLAAAHDRGVSHRDLKPANVFVTNDGHVKIVDFGLAAVRRSLEPTAAATATMKVDPPTAPGTVLGTIGYMSPEQVRGEPADHRADVFALGCLLFEMLTGQRAFAEATAVETLHAILKQEPAFDLLDPTQAPDGLLEVVRRCLEKRPVERFQSARDLAFSLQTLQSAVSSGAPMSGSVSRAARAAAARAAPRAIAVLPFTNLSGDAEMTYFSDGITEDIINALSELPDLRVAARTSSFAFRGQTADLATIGDRLKVETVLEGSVRRAGNRLRVTTRLIGVRDGYQLWAARYDRELDDVFAIQDDISANIARHLHLTLARGDRLPRVRPSTSQMEAYDLYLQGRYFVEQRGEGIAKGLTLLQKSLTLDPEFALAYAAVAETLALLAVYGIGKPAERLPQAQAAARKALALDAESPEVHNAIAMVKVLWEWDWDGAEAAFDRALQVNPNHVSARYWKGLLLLQWVRGNHEAAIAEIHRAVDLDPMAPIPRYALGLALTAAGRLDDAIRLANEGLEEDPTSALSYRVLSGALLARGDMQAGLEALDKGVGMSIRQAAAVGELGAALALVGRTDEARQIQAELAARSKTGHVPGSAHAVLAEALGDHEAAVGHMQTAHAERDPMFLMSAVWPSMVPLHADERVRRLYVEAGLTSVQP